jgi:hypothetical protein
MILEKRRESVRTGLGCPRCICRDEAQEALRQGVNNVGRRRRRRRVEINDSRVKVHCVAHYACGGRRGALCVECGHRNQRVEDMECIREADHVHASFKVHMVSWGTDEAARCVFGTQARNISSTVRSIHPTIV